LIVVLLLLTRFLYTGAFTTFVLDVSTSTIQPIISSILSLAAPSALTSLPLPYAPHPYRSLTLLLSSHLLTGIIVSPLDLIRTRLIAQSTLPPHRKYKSPRNALSQILKEEGGWKTIYLHPNLFIPTVLDYTFRPLLSLGAPLLIEHKLRLDPVTNPVSYSLAEFCISSASLLITLPIETIRRRLQVQTRSVWSNRTVKVQASRISKTKAERRAVNSEGIVGAEGADPSSVTGSIPRAMFSKPLRSCVETRPKPYEGVLEAIWRIVTEESGTTPVKKSKTKGATTIATTESQQPDQMHDSGILAKQGHSSLGGIYSLYRGLGFAISANAVVFALTTVTGERAGSTAGWAEI
jgi:fusion and transport protein UGO1